MPVGEIPNAHTIALPSAGDVVLWTEESRAAMVTNTRVPPAATTMSRGSSAVVSVWETRGPGASRLTMLMSSERWFTTHTSVLVRAATATGSRPTGTDP